MKVSEITLIGLAGYLRLDGDNLSGAEGAELSVLLGVARAFIASYTGLSAEEIDTHADFVIVVYVLVQDMYDNRVLYVEKNNLNKVVDDILGMHSKNYL